MKHSRIVIGLVFIGCIVYLILDLSSVYNLVSVAGLLTFVLICILISAHPSKVHCLYLLKEIKILYFIKLLKKINWRILCVGLEMQFILGVILMRTEFGYKLFKFISGQVTVFLEYTNRGSSLVFGDKYTDHIFAFQVTKF